MLENPARHKDQQLERHGFRYQPRLWASLTHLWLLGLAYALSFMLYVGATLKTHKQGLMQRVLPLPGGAAA